MVFSIKVQSLDVPVKVAIDIWDDNYTSNTKICSTTFDLTLTQEESGINVLLKPRAVNLQTSSGQDGGILRYSARLVSFKELERRLETFDALAQIPLLLPAAKAMLCIRDEACDLKGIIAKNLGVKSVIASVGQVCAAPYRLFRQASKLVLRKIVGYVL
mmetsp:Transcript_101728/g.158820  ORF Transcript_101728/g.158820 Transcript_101728/m.158820 type:complete len:159 (-) Transcript_101728:40-516(-)